MNALTVLYDADCPFCRRATAWLAAQAKLVRLDFVPAGSEQARQRFPELDHAETMRVITLIGDRGEVFRGDRAWLVCLWALRAWRPMANRLTGQGHQRFLRAATKLADRLRAMSKDEDCDQACQK
ncbi:DCC1-like thiol-disulfide oxidoreductase family protein [Actinosynnema sp. NPDC047251]|uniref:Thiol-disulfide oxidoreductase n=1 Tax=Saccharothrix espanaensis (strain ATCC 51144 / DSM 44229 / JCM 9112 / NBRC 15066 / NRRL 15764) TaxID=1179773 RepID=K0JWF1_SACES|nr:DCC1-like thiol-disulfide oxidoreductase family protein [Saccharothrix espanaensis]CCH29802.1 hypothetical protein BN6_24880 [Saccharothrix espanaensis DSM 44229]